MIAEKQYLQDGTEVRLIYFTFWDKVIIVCSVVGFLLLVLMCMVCILCPGCLFRWFCCHDEEEETKKQGKQSKFGSQRSTGSKDSKSSKGSYGSTGSDYYYSVPEGTDTGPLKWKPLDIIKEHDTGTAHSDWSSDAGSGQEVIFIENKDKSPTTEHHGLQTGDADGSSITPLESGTVDFSVAYSVTAEKLVIQITEVRDIKLAEGRTIVSPYMKIRLYRSPKQFFTFGGSSGKEHVINNLDKELKTRMQRPSDVLAYRESFEIPLEPEALKYYTVRLLLCDMDKLSRHMVLGETSVSFKKADLLNKVEVKCIEKLEPPTEDNLGNISLGLSYLPTSEKMYLTVQSIKGLRVMDKKTASTDACVKAYLMYDGKQLKRMKTTVRAMDLNPVFNESFSFDVPHGELGNIYFSLVISHYNAEKKTSKMIGRVYMGMTFGPNARDHWSSMMQNPRKKIVSSYKILN